MIHPQKSVKPIQSIPVLRIGNNRMFVQKALVELLFFLLFQPDLVEFHQVWWNLIAQSCSQCIVNAKGASENTSLCLYKSKMCHNLNGMHIHMHKHVYIFKYHYSLSILYTQTFTHITHIYIYIIHRFHAH